MEILSHFRTIEELTKTLSREQGLLSEMFEKRKLMKFPLGLALELVGGNETRPRFETAPLYGNGTNMAKLCVPNMN